MGALRDALEKQLKTEDKQDAEDCLKILEYLIEATGHVWESAWRTLVFTRFEGFPSSKRIYTPTSLGYAVLKGLEAKEVNEAP